jgi:hypothetical protein
MKKLFHKRFGAIAVEKGWITADQLAEALMVQAKENVEKAKHRLIGEILVDQGFLTDSQVDNILETMNQEMVYAISTGR